MELRDGQKIDVQGKSGRYTLERKGNVYSCTCPAWRNQSTPIEARTCKHLRAQLGDAAEATRVGTAAATGVPRMSRESSEARERRRVVMAKTLAEFPRVRDEVQRIFALRLPAHIAHAAGWWLALTDAEREEAWAYVGTGLAGVTEWFGGGRDGMTVKHGLDARLDSRFRSDPPEMLTVFGGNSDGSHWGLWYDDPRELPRAVVHNWARDTAETAVSATTLLMALRSNVAGSGGRWPLRAGILDWLDEALAGEREAHAAEQIPAFVERAAILGGLGPWLDGAALPADLPDRDARWEAYKSNSAVVGDWIARARSELAAGKPALALYLGRELHWVQPPSWRAEETELLVEGLRGFGRDALAEIARVHHAHRDLRNVDVYEVHSELRDALARGDVAEVARLARANPVEARSLTDTRDLALLDALIEGAGLDAAQAVHLFHVSHGSDASREVVRVLLPRGVVGIALERALKLNDAELTPLAIAHADLAWRGDKGESVLHVAAGIPSPSGVKALLARGADPKALDRAGKLAYDATRKVWDTDPKAASEVFDLLRAAGGAPAPAAPAVATDTWVVGTKVTHAKFGAGSVTAVAGKGADAKLTIKFADGASRTLLGKFVTRS